jgi:hypothetical protein
MTRPAQVLTAIAFILIAVLAALIISYVGVAYAPDTLAMMPKGSMVVSTAPMMGSELYYSTANCTACPVSLPPTSGQVDTAQSFGIIVSDVVSSLFSGLFR